MKRFFEARNRIEKLSKLSEKSRKTQNIDKRGEKRRETAKKHEESKERKERQESFQEEELSRRVPGGSSESAAGLFSVKDELVEVNVIKSITD